MIDNENPPELFVCFDIETDGPLPGENSMLSLGCVALTEKGEEVATFYMKLQKLPAAHMDPDTQGFWDKNPEAYLEATKDAQDPQLVILAFLDWLKNLMTKYTVVLVAYPSGFDFTFLYWYMRMFADASPLNHSCIDIRSFIMGMTGRPFNRTSKKYWNKAWKSPYAHTHNALDDAREQGHSFVKLLHFSRGRPE